MATAKKRAPAKAATVKKSAPKKVAAVKFADQDRVTVIENDAPGMVVMVGEGRCLVQLTERGGLREWYANEELKGAGDGD